MFFRLYFVLTSSLPIKMTRQDRSAAKKKQVYDVKLIDKISFTLGVFCLCSTEWLALRQPEWFPLYYLAIMTSLLVWRLITYTREKNQLFMLGPVHHLAKTSPSSNSFSLDFCYFMNFSLAAQIFLDMSNIAWFKVRWKSDIINIKSSNLRPTISSAWDP